MSYVEHISSQIRYSVHPDTARGATGIQITRDVKSCVKRISCDLFWKKGFEHYNRSEHI